MTQEKVEDCPLDGFVAEVTAAGLTGTDTSSTAFACPEGKGLWWVVPCALGPLDASETGAPDPSASVLCREVVGKVKIDRVGDDCPVVAILHCSCEDGNCGTEAEVLALRHLLQLQSWSEIASVKPTHAK